MTLASRPRILVDTGPLVAFLAKDEPHHAWAHLQFDSLPEPFITCEPVLTEAFFLTARDPKGHASLFNLLDSGFLVVDFSIAEEHRALAALMHRYRYRDLPMSLADACLVRLAELHPGAQVLTLDAHFRSYRKNGRQLLPVLAP